MEKQITVRVCDLCPGDPESRRGNPAKAKYRCPVCGRDMCSNHAENMDFIEIICTECRKAIDTLDAREVDTLRQQIVELLKPVIIISKL